MSRVAGRRRFAVAAAAAAAAMIVVTSACVGGLAMSAKATRVGSAPPPNQRMSLVACTWRPTLAGAPSAALLSMLGVLRRPAPPADAAPAIVNHLTLHTGGLPGREVYINYVRRARTFAGTAYFIVAVRDDGCNPHSPRGDTIWVAQERAGGEGSAGSSGGATAIEDGQWTGTGSPGIPGVADSATVTLVVPDDVARVTVHYPTGPANPGPDARPSLPAVTIDTTPIGNLVLYNVHRASSSAAYAPLTMTWRAANGRVIKTFHQL